MLFVQQMDTVRNAVHMVCQVQASVAHQMYWQMAKRFCALVILENTVAVVVQILGMFLAVPVLFSSMEFQHLVLAIQLLIVVVADLWSRDQVL
jgi:hypothetical protein